MASKKEWITLGSIVAILTIIYLIMQIFNLPSLPELFESFQNPKKPSISILIKPDHVNEGQYEDGMTIQLIIPDIDELNITSLKLAKNGVIIDRLNKNDQTIVASQIRWGDKSSNDFVINYRKGMSSRNNINLTASGFWYGCTNCFMGKESPYIFKFTLQYQVNDGHLTPLILDVEVPIT